MNPVNFTGRAAELRGLFRHFKATILKILTEAVNSRARHFNY